jgi:FixJ family two-component response regulator
MVFPARVLNSELLEIHELKRLIMISIVDDDRCVREATGELIESLGYGVLKFSSAEHFLQSGQIAETACLITDLQMPGLSGLELQTQLLARGHDTPVIFMTAFPEERSKTRALDAGAIGFLSKPFDDQSLIGCIEAALKNRRHRCPQPVN